MALEGETRVLHRCKHCDAELYVVRGRCPNCHASLTLFVHPDTGRCLAKCYGCGLDLCLHVLEAVP
jgi:hypothetical protein